MDFVERRIEQAQRAGVFDSLEYHGKPLPNLDVELPEGWWGKNFLKRDLAAQRLNKLMAGLGRRKGIAMLEENHEAVRHHLLAINDEITAANAGVDPKDRAKLVDIEAELARWRERRRREKWGRYFSD